jgi:two-component system cell cycle response regulator
MRKKILTVDDSKTVRIIVRKAFKAFDCDIFEAGNGVEGLAVAAKELPDLILLDITMPVMDGVETLTKLKSDPHLKGIPVMMLTAEGGKDHVLKIAKIGVRDYIVKPFKEDTLIEKANRIIELKPLADGPGRARSILDSAEILVVDDKPAIVVQIREGLKHTPWKINSVGSQLDAAEFCSRLVPDLIIASLALPEDGAYAFLRMIRTNLKTKYTPVFALVVKTETEAQHRAQEAGFNFVVTKPIDVADLESRMAKAMNLDMSGRYYTVDDGLMVLRLPENCTQAGITEAAQHLQAKLADTVDAGYNQAILDIGAIKALDVGVIKLLMQAMQDCRDLAMQFALVANAQLIAECRGYEDTRGWTFYETFEDAKANLGKGAAKPAPVLAGT